MLKTKHGSHFLITFLCINQTSFSILLKNQEAAHPINLKTKASAQYLDQNYVLNLWDFLAHLSCLL